MQPTNSLLGCLGEQSKAASVGGLFHRSISSCPPGAEREALVRKARQADVAPGRRACSLRGEAMIEQPHVNPYSLQARICLGIAAFRAALFVAALFMGMQ